MKKQIWINKAMIYAKTVGDIVLYGRFCKNKEKGKWEERVKDTAWAIEGTAFGVVLDNDNVDSPIITAIDPSGHVILELKYPDNPVKKYKEWNYNHHKREDLDMRISKMIDSNTNTEKIVSIVIDEIFSDIEENSKKKINELREEWL